MKGVFGRLGMVGAILVASALIFGAIAGGVVVHRLQASPAASSTQEQGQIADDQGDAPSKSKPAKPPKPPKQAHPSSPAPADPQDDQQDKDA